jgi:hypothetical protein
VRVFEVQPGRLLRGPGQATQVARAFVSPDMRVPSAEMTAADPSEDEPAAACFVVLVLLGESRHVLRRRTLLAATRSNSTFSSASS